MKRGVVFVSIIVAGLLFFPGFYTVHAEDYLKASDEDMEWWQNARFGLFIHWGPVSLKGTEIGWSRGGERRGVTGTGGVSWDEYDSLYKEFNPTQFNADEWVSIAKAAGMKYIVFTSKHHDGFCMFDAGNTDYKITSPECPFGRDIAKELADACHRGDIRLGYYYSPPDWRNTDYRTKHHDDYIRYMYEHIEQLCSNYGPLDILWFDSLQVHTMSGSGGEEKYPEEWAEVFDSKRLFQMIREYQPHIIINNRCGLEGDFDTPEQHVGLYQTDRPWESCITICSQWAWKPGDTLKSLEECIHTLAMCAGGDGNLLLNVGPMPDGRIEQRQIDRLMEIGDWLRINGESIYGTRGGPVPPQSWGVTTHRGNTIFVHVLETTDPVIALPSMDIKIKKAALIDGTPVQYSSTKQGTMITMPDEVPDSIDTVIILTMDREIKP